ncbi:MAG: outer membrane beta-barrel protein [Prevotella sp.]|jgi:hypothetical protein|nr:outer membrane beta-barrel protein [Prevotella sp.]MCH4212750.1 outer membrane beta-barrel protein [Prevotella sp.]MCH4242163.1 outer membrane beta-barrel protein [Prevotella sp.]
MKRVLLIVFTFLLFSSVRAQRITYDFRNVTMPEALCLLNRMSRRYTINFIYDDLEDFRVTTHIRNLPVPEAINQLIGFYPIRQTFAGDSTISVECIQQNRLHYKGCIVDEHHQPAEYANIILLSLPDSTILGSGVSNESGYFVIPCTASKVMAKISYIGYKTIRHIVTNPNMGTIQLHPERMTIRGIVVKGNRPQYRLSGEGIITNVENTVLSQLGTAEDVMRHIPGIIKRDKNYEVVGKGEPLIFIDGRRIYDITALDRLKSDEIKSVELITTPGVQYQASAKSVVKIRTKNVYGEGWGVDLRSSCSQSENCDLREQVNWNYRKNKLDLFGSVDYTRDKGRYPSEIMTKVRSDTLWNQKFSQSTILLRQSFLNILGVNYIFGRDNSAGLRYTLTCRPDGKGHNNIKSLVTANGRYYDFLDTKVASSESYSPDHQLNAYYIGKIMNWGIIFNGDYLFNKSYHEEVYHEFSDNEKSRTVNAYNNVRNRLLAVKLSLDHLLFGGKLTIGTECSHIARKDDYINPEGYVPTDYGHLRENNFSGFAQYNHNTPIGRVSAGFRYEDVDFKYDENNNPLSQQYRHFHQIFPSLSIESQWNRVHLQFGYTARTYRPSYQQLSNFVDYGNRYLLQSGNPLLRDECIHDITLTGLWRWLRASIGYNDRRHVILYWAEPVNHNSSVTKVTYINFPTLKSLSAMIDLSPKLGIWSPELSAEIRKQWLSVCSSDVLYHYNKPVCYLSFTNVFDFGRGWLAGADFSLITKGDEENNYYFRYVPSIDVSMTKSWNNGRTSLQIKGTDLTHSVRYGNLMQLGCIETRQLSSSDSRQLIVTLRYNFNMTKSKYKGTGAGNEEKKRL